MSFFDIFKKKGSVQETEKNRLENMTPSEKKYMSKEYQEQKDRGKQQALDASKEDGFLPEDTTQFYKDVHDHWDSSARHFELISIIEEEYKRLNSENLLNDENACVKIIALCKEDIALAPEMKEYFLKTSPNLVKLPRYPSFKRLSIVYENLGDINNAIKVLEQAIELGFDSDSTKSGLQGRMEKLTKKL